MRILLIVQSELCAHIRAERFGVLPRLHCFQHTDVNLLLISLLYCTNNIFFRFLIEYIFSFLLRLLFVKLHSLEILVVNVFRYVEGFTKIYFRGGCNQVDLINPSQRTFIENERSCNKAKAGSKLFQKYDPLSFMGTTQNNAHYTRRKVFLQVLTRLLLLVMSPSLFHLSWVIAWWFFLRATDESGQPSYPSSHFLCLYP